MSKTLARNTHWMPKTGSYAVRLNRRGDIGTSIPTGAADPVYEANERRRQGLINALKLAEAERADALTVVRNRQFKKGPEQLAAEKRNSEARRRVAELQNEMRLVNALLTPDGRAPTKRAFEKCFVDAAYVLLDSGTFTRICNEAERLMRRIA